MINKQELMANPFGSKEQDVGVLGQAETQRAIQEIQAAMVIAKRFPRDPIVAMDRIIQACTRPKLAEAALYAYAKGGSTINGPSIHLAKAIAQSWGNIQYGIRELSQGNGESTVEAFAFDLESNTREVKVFQVPHVRDNGKKVTSARDIYELTANVGARRMRACILGVVPGDVVEAAVAQCELTLKSTADTSPEAVAQMVEAFSEYGVTTQMLQKFLQCRPDAIRPAQMVRMRSIFRSIKDGVAEPWQFFEGASASDLKAGAISATKAADAAVAEPTAQHQPEPLQAEQRQPAEQTAGTDDGDLFASQEQPQAAPAEDAAPQRQRQRRQRDIE